MWIQKRPIGLSVFGNERGNICVIKERGTWETMNCRINGLESVMKTFKPGELVLLAGHPGSGMTALDAEMAE